MDRREFLFRGAFLTGLGALGAALAGVFGDLWTAAHKFSSARWVPVAPMNQLQQDCVAPFPEYKIAIVKSGLKIGAMSLECTHLGCVVNVVDRGFFCPCHGSDFGSMGEVYSGPAHETLPWHEVINREGTIWVHLGEKLNGPRWLMVEAGSPDLKKG